MPSPIQLVPAYFEQDRQFVHTFSLLGKAIEDRAFPGAVLAVAHRGSLVAYKARGRFTYDSSSPTVLPETIYDLASLTKPVATATAAMLLFERGLLDLEMALAQVIPEFEKSAKPDQRRLQVSLKMLLAHTSGLPAYARLFETANTRESMIRAACRLDLEADPGARREYSDIGFILLGVAVERIADEPLDRFCQREVFGPLGMAATGFCPPAALRTLIPPTEQDDNYRKRLIQGEVQDENAAAMGGVAGHAGLFAPALELAVFAQCMLRGGSPILRSETHFTAEGAKDTEEEPRDCQVAGFPGITVSSSCATSAPSSVEAVAGGWHPLGWDIPTPPSQSGRYFSARAFGHLGYAGTSLWIDPERELSVILLTNRTWPDRKSQLIKQVRPALHDTIVEELGAD